jgi:hypothetical protein
MPNVHKSKVIIGNIMILNFTFNIQVQYNITCCHSLTYICSVTICRKMPLGVGNLWFSKDVTFFLVFFFCGPSGEHLKML